MNTDVLPKSRQILYFNGVPLEQYQLPDGTYQYTTDSIAKTLTMDFSTVPSFLHSSVPEAKPVKHIKPHVARYLDGKFPHARFLVPFEVVIAFWTYWANRGNVDAIQLLASVDRRPLTFIPRKRIVPSL